ncbi:MAG: phosphonate ABC transporter, permease protein PhnE [Fibrobacterota bacterium]
MHIPQKNLIQKVLLSIVCSGVVIYSFYVSNVSLTSLFHGIPMLTDMVNEMIPPDFSRWQHFISLVWETLVIGIWGTCIGTVISLPIGFLAARNTSPSKVVYTFFKTLVTISRSIPEIIYALVLVSAVGMGNIPGILAIAIHTVGLASKFFSEAIENIDPKPVEGVESTGSHVLHVIRHSIIPQIIPLFSGYTLFILDHNIRVTVAIGVVGAGGIGVELYRRMRQFQYEYVSAIILMIFAIVMVLDRISSYVRQATLDGTFLSRGHNKRDTYICGGFLLILLLSLPDFAGQIIPLMRGIPTIIEVVGNMFPPDFTDLFKYIVLLVETVGMAVAGTIIAIMCSIFFGILSARNIIRFRPLSFLSSEITNFCRAMPDIMFALIFVVAVGLGPFAGVIALTLSSIGFLGKFYAEAIENIDPKIVEAVRATGANTFQTLRHAVVPQILPLFNSYNLYILDRNIRASTVLGIVGAGGIGFELTVKMRLFDYPKVMAITLCIFAVILTVDYLSTYLRKKIID